MFKKMFTTEMSGDRKLIENRFSAIISAKKRGVIVGISVVCAAVIICAAVMVNGAVSGSTKIYGVEKSKEITQDAQFGEGMNEAYPNIPEKNPYNDMYIDVTGRTVAEVAEEAGMDYIEFLKSYNLPEDMPKDTTETAAYNMVPLGKRAEEYNMTLAEIKEMLALPDEVTANTPWGEALNKASLGAYVGTGDVLKQFIEYFGLDSSVNEDTKWEEIRFAVEEKNRQLAIEEKRKQEQEKMSPKE